MYLGSNSPCKLYVMLGISLNSPGKENNSMNSNTHLFNATVSSFGNFDKISAQSSYKYLSRYFQNFFKVVLANFQKP